MANFWGGWTPPRHSGTWVGARVASLRCHYPPPRRSQYSRNAKARPHKSKTSCRGGHRRGTTTSGPGCGPLAGFEVTLYGRFWGDRRGTHIEIQPPAPFQVLVVAKRKSQKVQTRSFFLQVHHPCFLPIDLQSQPAFEFRFCPARQAVPLICLLYTSPRPRDGL